MKVKEFLGAMCLISFDTIENVVLIDVRGNTLLTLNVESLEEDYSEYKDYIACSFAITKKRLSICIRA